MRTIEYLSPSALTCWIKNPQEYYLRYLSPNRPPKLKQTQPMSVGSAFDAYLKSRLSTDLGLAVIDCDALFDRQVEDHNRAFARGAGERCLDSYLTCGAYSGLLTILESADEVNLEGSERVVIDGVPILGKPDIGYTFGGHRVVHELKVTGYCANYKVSPLAGYKKLYPDGQEHKDYQGMQHASGLEINIYDHIEQKNTEWGRQLCCYGWINGCKLGEEMIVMLDQLVCSEGKIKVGHHRCVISESFQRQTFQLFRYLWELIASGHIFRELSSVESEGRCRVLDEQAAAYSGDTPEDDFIRRMSGR